MTLRILTLFLILSACKSASHFVVSASNTTVFYTKVLGGKSSARPFVMFEVEVTEENVQKANFTSLIFEGTEIRLEKNTKGQNVGYWYPTADFPIEKANFETVILKYKDGMTEREATLKLQSQKPMFLPMLPKSKENE